MIHQLAEAALCRGDAEATEQLARARSAGRSRHEALHEIGERLVLRQIAGRNRS